MPQIKRKRTAERRARLLGLLFDLWQLSRGRVPLQYQEQLGRHDPRILRELYEENREALILSERLDLADCVPFWAYEPGIPAELRLMPDEDGMGAHYYHPNDPAAQRALEDDVERVKGQRIAWLALHPAKVA